MELWVWLQRNSASLQSIAALAGAVLTLVTIWVLVITWRSIERQAVASELQAGAARALMRVAEEQTKAAQASASAANMQTRLFADQLELSTAPLLVFEPDARVNNNQWRLVNRGKGIAFQVHLWQGGFEHFHPRPGTGYSYQILTPSTLAPGEFVYVDIPALWKTWTLKYRGVDDQTRATKMNRDNQGGQHYIIRRGGREITLDDFPRPNGEKAIGDWTE